MHYPNKIGKVFGRIHGIVKVQEIVYIVVCTLCGINFFRVNITLTGILYTLE